MKTLHLTKSYKSFLSESKCNIRFKALNFERISLFSITTIWALCSAFYFIENALLLWQCVFAILMCSALLVKQLSSLFYTSDEVLITIALPSAALLLNGQTFLLTNNSRKNGLGFWLSMKATSSPSNINQCKQVFVPRFELNREQTSHLSYLVKSL